MWSAIVIASLTWNVYQTRQGTLDVARIQARDSFMKDIVYRRWNAGHGGVYVPVTDESPPNPYLEVPERDITTQSDIVLTLMNPAYMTRQVHELGAKAFGIQGHITSLNPIRPANAPDSWEARALESFQDGVKEFSSIEELKGNAYMRFIRPLITEEGCLKCHAKQGYKVGDIRGGISVSIPMSPLWAVERSSLLTIYLGHGLLWLVGLVGVGFGARRLSRQINKRKRAENELKRHKDHLEERVAERTAELKMLNQDLELEVADHKQTEESLRESEERLQSFMDSATDGFMLFDSELNHIELNKVAQEMRGLERKDIIGKNITDTVPNIKETGRYDEYKKVMKTGVPFHSPDLTSHPLNGNKHIEIKAFKVGDGLGVIVTDITERKQAEEALRTANKNLLKEHNQRKLLSKRLIDLLEKDRHDIAMELHDHIGQVLTSLKINLEMIGSQLKPTKTELASQIKAAEQKAIQTLKDIKNISHGLMPGTLDALGLLPSLRGLFDEVQEYRDIKINFFNKNVPKRFDQEKELAIYRIVQEALTNVVKHAKAKNVFVNLLKKGNVLSLSVEDDGVGFDQDKAMKISKGKGPLGLVIMRERAMQLDGELTIESPMGKGTHLLIEVPI